MKKNHLLSFLLPLAIMGVAFFFRYYPHNYCAPGCVLLRHDELNYLNRVLGFLNGSWDVHYFINPTLYAYLLYAATAASGLWATLSGRFASFSDFALSVTFDPYPILVAGRFVTLVAGTATVGLVYAVSRRLFSPWVAVVASLALALDVTHARRGVLTGNECVTALLCVLLFACLLHYLRRPGAGRHALCGFVLGLAGAVKYNAFIFVLPLMAASCMAALREEDLRAQPPWSRFRLCAVRSLVRPKFMAAYLFLVVGFFAGSPCILLNFNDFASEFFRQYSYLQDGFSDFDRVADHLGYLYYLTNFSAMNSGHAVSALCGAGLVVMGIAAIRKQDFRYILLVSAALPLYLFLGKGTFSRMRFLLPAIPFILISGAWFFTTIMEFLTGLSRKRDLSHAGRIKRHAIIAVVAAAVLIPGAVQVRAVMEEVYAHDQRHEIMLWIKENLEPEDKTLEFVHSSFYQFPGSSRVLELYQYKEAWFEPGPGQEAWKQFKSRLFVFEPLQDLLARAKTVADLKMLIRDGGYRNLLVTLPTGFYEQIEKLPQIAPKVIMHCPYWIEFLEYVAGLPLRHRISSPDGSLTMVLYSLR